MLCFASNLRIHWQAGPSKTILSARCFSSAQPLYSGHNKWSKIKQKKGVADTKKSALLGRAAREIIVAVRSGGSTDPSLNAMLANVLKWAKESDVPKDNIEKAIARATGANSKTSSAHMVYEAMVGGRVAVIIECLTDNHTRTVVKVREILNDNNGRLAPVKFLFDKVGRVQVELPPGDDREARIEAAFDAAGSAGGEDFEIVNESDIVEYFCPPEALEAMTKAISDASGEEAIIASEHVFRPKDAPEGIDEELEESILELKEAFEDNEDCLRVWTSIDPQLRLRENE